MPENKGRFVAVCQKFLALGAVAAIAAPAAGIQSLDIVAPTPETVQQPGASAPAVALVASDPVEPEVTEVPIKGVERAGLQALTRRPAAQRKAAAALAALSSPTKVDGFATVGVTWDPGQTVEEDEVSVFVRSLEDRTWSAWETIEYHDDHGPDPDSAEARRARPGTEPIVVGDVDEVQVKVVTADGEAPAGTTLAVVDPRDTPDPTPQEPAIDTAALPEDGDIALSSATTTSTTGSGAASDPATETEVPAEGSEPGGVLAGGVGITPKPKIFSRAQWGADESLRDKSSLRYYEVHAGFVHHTVNANSYTRAQVPALLRGIYAYHTKSRGWSDIGYNFVVDRFGRIWEGRYGGVDRPVVGAHTLNYNEYSFAMSALGNFDTAKPSSAMLDAYGRLFAWKLSLHGVSAASTSQWVGSKYFPAINGHRDAGSTACPGRYLYAQLGKIRSLASQYQAPFTARTRMANLAGSPWPDLVVRDATTKRLSVVRTGGQTNFQRGQRAAAGWKGMDLIAAARDVTGDGIPDVVARNAATKVTSVYPGTAQATLGKPALQTNRFSKVDQLVGAMDMTGDGNPDLVARVGGTTNLWVYPGNGKGGFLRRKLMSREWAFPLTAAVGDLDGDKRNDLVARKGGRLYLVPGSTRPRLGTPVQLPGRWGQFSLISGAGDVTNDGEPDLVVKVKKSRNVFVYPGDGAGGFGERLGPFRNLGHLNFIAPAGQLAGEAGTDLIGRNGKGVLLVFPNNGARNIEAVTDAGLTLKAANLILNVGDWNGDGFGDIMSRTPRGRMDLRLGNGSGGWSAPIVAARGWRGIGLVAAVGDITGDGHPDLMGQPSGKAMRIYPGNGKDGFLSSYVAHSPIKSDRHTGLGLWDTDGSPDTLARRGDGALLLFRGNGPGGLLNPTTIGKVGSSYDWLQSVGDATGDSRPDVVARESATGKLWLLPGTRKGFGIRRLIAGGFGSYDLSS